MFDADVYRNLHRQTLSLRDRKSGRVVTHPKTVTLQDVTFVVQPAGRRKVLETKRKNVHAFVRGKVHSATQQELTDRELDIVRRDDFRQAYYNPYDTDKWVDMHTGEPVTKAKWAIVSGKRVFYRV